MTGTTLSPREVSRLTGVSTDSLRHYERLGLLARAPRTAAGYRRHPPATVGRVQLIQRALAVGFSLRELAEVLTACAADRAPCRRVQRLVEERLAALERRIAELTALRG